jgi:GAF domain-containing protein
MSTSRFETFPRIDADGTVDDLWLINSADWVLIGWEMRLVQHVANQCAIAIRQARL